MSVNVSIKKTKDISIEEIAKFNKLSYGIMDENLILDFNKVGNTTTFYCPSCIGRGFDVFFEDNNICLRMPLPSTPTDIAIFYDVVIKIAKYMKEKDVIRDDEKIPVSKLADFIELDQNISIDWLSNFYSQIISGEMETFTLFCALNPITFSKNEFEYINGSLDNFERLLSSLQEKDVYYAGPKLYRRKEDGSLFGLYFIDEDVPTVIPIEPVIYNQDCVVSDYYCFIHGDNTIPYKDFISNVTKKCDYDSRHIIVSIDEKKINFIAKKYGVDTITGEKKYNKYLSERRIDNGFNHNNKITNMELTCDKLAGFNHLVVFLKWAYLNNLLREDFLDKVPKLKEAFEESLESIRTVLYEDEYLEGKIRVGYFVEKAHKFVREFYKFNTYGYPECVDKYAEAYLGTEEYNSDKYKNEAYLFVPFDDNYYLGLSKYIDEEWKKYNK